MHVMYCHHRPRLLTALFSLVALTACQGLEAPTGLAPARRSGGPVVVFDLFAHPLPEIPLPNDIATRPDPTSPTGRRINASQVASLDWEVEVRAELDRRDGWGTFAPIAVSFEPTDQLLDMGNVLRRHSRDDFDFSDDAVYVINIDRDSPDFGRAMPLDLGEGSFPATLRNTNDYYDNDPRGHTPSLLFDSTFEDTNGNGRLDLCEDVDHDGVTDPGEDLDGDGVAFSAERDANENGLLDPEEDLNHNGRLDCSEDTDFDGHLDVPNLFCGDDDAGRRIPPQECPDVVVHTAGSDVTIPASDAWLTTWYEQETNTLILQPLLPLAEQTTYAVVLTRRLVDEEGRAVESPFDGVNHVDQSRALEPLPGILASDPETFGGLTMDDVQFAWTFTTQSVTSEFRAIREGLYGRGPMASLAEEFPPNMRVDRLHGCRPGIECDLPENEYIMWALDTDGERGLLTIIQDLLDQVPVDLGVDQAMIDQILLPFDAVDYFVLFRFDSPNFLEHDGVTEDVDGDGRLDLIDEDVDGNGLLSAGEDLDFDWHLDVNEDLNGNLILDGEEGFFDLDIPAGRFPHGRHSVTTFVTVPRPDPERGIEPPFPVVIYNHGYGVMRIESLILAAYLARHGLATVGMDAVHHGIGGIDPFLIEIARGLLVNEDLGPLVDALVTDRALDLNGDGATDSGADYFEADAVHTRDMLRQTQVDLAQLVRLIRGFDGARTIPQDLDGDGEEELAGDFNGDGVVDFGGPDAEFYATGNSLGGINTTLMAGLEPAVVASAPISAGGQLSTIGFRSTLGSVQAAGVLPAIGPLIVTSHAEASYDLLRCADDETCPRGRGCVQGVCRCEDDRDCGGSGYRCFESPTALAEGGDVCAERRDTACTMRQVSARFVVNDLNDDVDVELACIDEDELRPGDTLVARNLDSGERDCFVAWPGARSRMSLPGDQLDPVSLSIYEGEVLAPGAPCTLRDDAHLVRFIDTFEVEAHFQQRVFAEGEPLVLPQRGFGLHRATPSLRRMLTVVQTLLDPADPANMAVRHFRDPVDYGDETRAAPLLNVSTIGDTAVPISNGMSIARAAGILDFQRLDPRLTDARHPEGMTQNRFLIERGVIEGVVRTSIWRRPRDDRQILFDPDDFDRDHSRPDEEWLADGFDAPSEAVPLRAWTAVSDGEVCTCIDGSGEHDCTWPGDTVGVLEMVRCPGGVAAQATAYLDPGGSHALIPQSNPQFDVHAFMGNMIGRYFATQGRELRFDVCMQDSSCTVEENGFYTPPVVHPDDEEEGGGDAP